uniref:zinc finger HIT domain-containing protein 2 n=1 Tax=Myxine glutinosa TaxID=7769 RepID=UPI00358E1AF3
MMETIGSATDLCHLCHGGVRATYTCPRCNIRYCSVGCYRAEAHSTCSEAFYRDCCLERLRDHRRPGPDQKVLRGLQNVARSGDEYWDPGEQNGDEDDAEQDEQTLEQRMEGLDLDRDSDRVWERLTEREKREFDGLISRGEAHRLIPPWVPWWERTAEPQNPGLVEELDPGSGLPLAQPNPAEVPAQDDPPAALSELLGKPPSPTVGPALASVLFAYALTARNYAGTLDSEAALAMLAASPALGGGVAYRSAAVALQDALRLARERGESRGSCLLSLHDSARLLRHARWSCAALAEAGRALNAARRGLLRSSARSCFLAKKKTDFLRSWIAAESGALPSLAAEAQREYEESSAATQHLDEDRERLEEAWGGPRPPNQRGPLVQEL